MSLTDTQMTEFCLTKGKLSRILDSTDSKFLLPWLFGDEGLGVGGEGCEGVFWEEEDCMT